jgi:amino acid transporter
MGNFWGFQEAWFSLMASIFDMAIYPTLFVIYLSRLYPWFGEEGRGVLVGLAMVAVCTALNVAGIRVVALTSEWFFFLIVSPFVAIAVLAPFKAGELAAMPVADGFGRVDLVGGILIAMWNYMGWDNASTIAAEVDRPQRTYPRAMLLAVGLVALTYVIPVAAMWLTGLPASAWAEGSWVAMAEMVGGPALRVALALGGAISAFGMFNALVMSYSRLPLAMAQDGMLPRAFARLHPRTRAPWVAILACSIGWAACLGLGFERLVTIDILLYGLSLGLEFVALVVLRIKEPDAPRPFRIPGGTLGTILLGVPPVLLLGFSIVRSQREEVFGINGIAVGLLLIAAGCAAYWLTPVARGVRASRALK